MIEVTVLDDMDTVHARVRKLIGEGKVCEVSVVVKEETRTLPQNASLHLWLSMMSKAMNKAGFTHRKLWEEMKTSFDIPVTPEMLKDIAQNVSFDMFKKKHTSKLSTTEMQKLYETLNLAFGQSVGVSLPWPSRNPPTHD